MTQRPPAVRGFIAAIIAVLGLTVVFAPVAWAADGDVVRQLDVTYDVQTDGTIEVTYVLDWDFGETGRRGIEFGIPTTEDWDADSTKRALYNVSDLTVTSPTPGVPSEFSVLEPDRWSDEMLVRIGDRDQPLSVDRATYVISYTLGGALRTFDGMPQLYWDVTGRDYPPIEAFTVTVRGPSDIPRARCLVGSRECDARVVGRQATMHGREVDAGDSITVVAEFAAGAINGAEPNLVDRTPVYPALQRLDATVQIDHEGRALVHERFALSPGEIDTVTWKFPERRSVSGLRDQLYEITKFEVRDASGVLQQASGERLGEGGAQQRLVVEFEATQADSALPESELPGSEVTEPELMEYVATYTVNGAVTSDGDTAEFIWPVSTLDNRDFAFPRSEQVRWRLPGEVVSSTCRSMTDLGDSSGECGLDGILAHRGSEVTWQLGLDDDTWMVREWLVVSFDGSAVGMIEPQLGWSAAARGWLIAAIVLILVVALPTAGFFASRVRMGERRDLRYRDLSPGVVDSDAPTSTARRRGVIPVRFEPPQESLARVGAILDRAPKGRHVAATMINMAVNGAIELQTKPLTVKHQPDGGISNNLENAMANVFADSGASTEVLPSDKRRLWRVTRKQFDRDVRRADFFRPWSGFGWPLMVWWALVALAGTVGVALLTWLASANLRAVIVLAVVAAGLVIGGIVVDARRRLPALSAKGTAVKEQALGFRQYLRTAEKHQLNVEAQGDIFERYLPWAVLFGEVKHWTKVCRELASTTDITPPSTSFLDGHTSLNSLGGQIASVGRTVAWAGSPLGGGYSGSSGGWDSSGGSGGSSGFSGGASGGGGGGGTSASSW